MQESERGRQNRFCHAEAPRQTLHELGLACPKIASQTEEESGIRAPPISSANALVSWELCEMNVAILHQRARAVLGSENQPGVDVIFPMQVSGVAGNRASKRPATDGF